MSFIDKIKSHPITNTVSTGLAYPFKAIAKGYDFYNRKVEDLTKKLLPPTAAKVVQEFARALPFTLLSLAALFYLPPLILIPGAVITAIAVNPLTNRQSITWYNSMGMTEVVLAARTASLISSSPHPIALAVITGVFAGLAGHYFYRAYSSDAYWKTKAAPVGSLNNCADDVRAI